MSSEMPRIPRNPKSELAAIRAWRPPSVAAGYAAEAAAEAMWCWEVTNADRLRDRLRTRLVGRGRKRLAAVLVENADRLSRRSLIEILGLLEAQELNNHLTRRATRRG